MKPFRGSVISLVIVAGSALVLGGCSTEVVHTISSQDIEEPRPQTAPANVLENIALAHRNLDTDLYASQFDPSFELRTPKIDWGDFGDPWSRMEGTDYDKDLESTRVLFETSEWITFELEYESAIRSTTRGYPAEDGFWQVRAHSINIRIQPKEMDDTLAVTNEQSIFVFAADTSTDPPIWRVVCQQLFWPDD